jgi:general secretion pathway protein G
VRASAGLDAAEIKTGYERGVTLLEVAVMFAVIGVLGFFLLEGAAYMQEVSEKTAEEQQAAAFEQGVQLEAASRMAGGRENEIPLLARDNPVQWLESKPQNYLGEFGDGPPKGVKRGTWYYDASRRHLVYLVNRGEHFRPGAGGEMEIRLRVVVDPPQRMGSRAVARVSLHPSEEYAWF